VGKEDKMKLFNLLVNLIGVVISYQILRALGLYSFLFFLAGFWLAFNFRNKKITISLGLFLMILSFLLPAILYWG
jgi:hypothetical protein